MTALIANPEEFFPASIRALRSEMQAFHDEAWYTGLIAGLRQVYPLFEKYWTLADAQPAYSFAARPLTPLEMHLPAHGAVRFRIMAEPFVQDRRFRVIYCLPATPGTMQQCADWASLS